MPKLYFGEPMKKSMLFLLLFIKSTTFAGEIDGKGLICKIYGDRVGYYFEKNRTFEYKLIGGEKKLELKSKDIGKYYTNENFIFINEIKINRKNLKYQRFSSFRGQCKAFKDLKDFLKNFNVEHLTKENKI